MAQDQSPEYKNWLDAAKGGNLASYLYRQAPSLNALAGPPNPNIDPTLADVARYASIPAKLLTGAVGGAVGAVSDAGRNALTSPPMMSSDNDDSSTMPMVRDNLRALGVVGSPQTSLADGGALGVFGGLRGAETLAKSGAPRQAMSDMLAASNAEKAGLDPKDIWESHGVFRAPDEDLRFEIPDSNAKLNDAYVSKYGTVSIPWDGEHKLGDLMDHPELFSAYPELKDVTVKNVPLANAIGGMRGGFDSSTNTMYLSGDPKDALSTALHEAQHYVQSAEGHARGGNSAEFLPENFADAVAQHRELDKAVSTQLEDAHPGMNSYRLLTAIEREGKYGSAGHAEKFPATSEMYNAVKSSLGGDFLDQFASIHEAGQQLSNMRSAAFDRYQRLAGEQESRLVQERHAQGDYESYPPDFEALYGGANSRNPMVLHGEQTPERLKYDDFDPDSRN